MISFDYYQLSHVWRCISLRKQEAYMLIDFQTFHLTLMRMIMHKDACHQTLLFSIHFNSCMVMYDHALTCTNMYNLSL